MIVTGSVETPGSEVLADRAAYPAPGGDPAVPGDGGHSAGGGGEPFRAGDGDGGDSAR